MPAKPPRPRKVVGKFYLWIDDWLPCVEASLTGVPGGPGNLLVVLADGKEILRRGFAEPLADFRFPFTFRGLDFILLVNRGHGPVFEIKQPPHALPKITIWRHGLERAKP